MHYVGQICRFLKTRFSEHYRRTKKPHKIDNFLYRLFKQTNHSTSSISIQPVEKITYGYNSTKRYRNILRHEKKSFNQWVGAWCLSVAGPTGSTCGFL